MDPADFDAIASAVREFVDREVIPREDEIEEGHGSVTPLRLRRAHLEDQLGDSSEPKVSKTS